MTRFCAGCHRYIAPGQQATPIMGDDYHSNCLYCQKCGILLWDKPFVKKADKKLYCDGQCEGVLKLPPIATKNQRADDLKYLFPKKNDQEQSVGQVGNQMTPRSTQKLKPIVDNIFNNESFGMPPPSNPPTKSKISKTSRSLNQASFNGFDNYNPDEFSTVKRSYNLKQKENINTVDSSMEDVGKCEVCSKSVYQKEKFIFEDKLYHQDCLTCEACNVELFRMKRILKDPEGTGKFCEPCFYRLYAPKCGKCNQPVASYMLSVTYDKKMYHKECFICPRCKGSLATREFKKSGNLLICRNCY